MEQALIASSIHADAYDTGIGITFENDTDFRYFCTPMDAYVFAYTGGDGVHFCTIPELFGDMIFIIEPMPRDDIHVRPVARNFEDFIRILLAVRYTGILLDVPFQTESEFYAGIQKYKDQYETSKHAEQLHSLAAFYDVTPIDDPYTYICSLQDTFAYDMIPFSDDYYESVGIPNPNK